MTELCSPHLMVSEALAGALLHYPIMTQPAHQSQFLLVAPAV